jgi:protein O-mannosyl-transferase
VAKGNSGSKSKRKPKPHENRPLRDFYWGHWLGWLALLFLLNLLAYSDSFHAGWHFDDLSNIVNNRDIQIRSLSWDQLKHAWSSRVGGIRPIAYLSFALNYYVSGLEVLGYHLVNFALHIGNTILVFFVASRLSRRSHPTVSQRSRWLFSFFAAALWSLSPVQTQAVTYVVQRMTVLAAFFVLLSFLFYLQAREARMGWHRWLGFAASALFGILAFGSKENSFILPALLLACEFLIFVGGRKERPWKPVLLGILAVLLFAGAIWHYWGLSERLSRDYQGRDFTLKQRLLTESRIVVTYLTQLALPLPSRLALHHEIEYSNSPWSPPTTLLSMAVHAGLLFLAWRLRKTVPLVTFSIAWFYLNHLIESTVFPLELMFEHRSYLPSVGFFLVAAVPVLEVEKVRRRERWRVPVQAILIFFVLASAVLAYQRNRVWQDDFTLWRDNLEKYPNSFRVHDNLGTAYAARGDDAMAGISFRESVRLNPWFPGARINLALLALRNGKREDALRWIEGLDDNDLTASYYYNLGVIHAGCGQLTNAVHYYSRAIVLDGSYAEAYYNLGLVQIKRGDSVGARKSFAAFLRTWRGDPNTEFVMKAQSYLK